MENNQDIPDLDTPRGAVAGSVSSLPMKNPTSPDKDKSPISIALEELDNAISALDNQLANFYDDIKSVLGPEGPQDSAKVADDTDTSVSEITAHINGKRDLILRIAAHLRETRSRIEL